MSDSEKNKKGNKGVGKKANDKNPAKSMKRDFELVSPTSPEIQLNLTGIRQLLKEELEPITDDINKIKESLHFNSEKLDEIATIKCKGATIGEKV